MPAPKNEPTNPATGANATASGAISMAAVERILAMIRPAVQDDGGDVELVSVEQDGLVRIRLHGAYVGCPSAHLTLHHGIERALRAELGDHIRVEAVA
jgi:Fe-S cluster biogenesis protein NfuA